MKVRIDVEIEYHHEMRRIAYGMITGGYLHGDGESINSPLAVLRKRLREYLVENRVPIDDPEGVDVWPEAKELWETDARRLADRLWRNND